MASSVVNVTRGARLPVVVVLGATGTGKSKLAIEIARKFSGEIISADSMQVYRGLDIITNKINSVEEKQARHHLLNFLDPLSRYSVVDYRNAALPLMEKLLSQGTMPVIVGGTNYYIESLLWNVLVETAPDSEMSEQKLVYERDKEIYEFCAKNNSAVCDESAQKKNKSANILKKNDVENRPRPAKISRVWQDTTIPTEELYKELMQIDEASALQYHPNNRRKIIRSLQVWEQTGRRHSEVLTEQQQQVGGSKLGGALRYKNTAILWITCQQDVLDLRLDDRVDGMIRRGLLQELLDFHAAYNAARLQDGQEADYTTGIFQSIGFKEFHPYLVLSEEEKKTDRGRRLYETGVEALKQVTRRYSRKQARWIRNRFILPSKRQVPPLYTVDGTDPSRWNEKVTEPALNIVQALINGEQPTYETVKFSKTGEFADIDTNDKTRFECDVCGRVVIGQLQWRSHLKGAKHRKMLKRKRDTNITS